MSSEWLNLIGSNSTMINFTIVADTSRKYRLTTEV